MKTLNTKQALQVGFYEKQGLEGWISDTENLKSWDKKPFFNDGWIFNPSHNDPDEAVERFYDNTESGIKGRDYRRLYRNFITLLAVWGNMGLYQLIKPWFKNSSLSVKTKDTYWDWKLIQEYERVKAEQFPIELSQQEKAAVRVGEGDLSEAEVINPMTEQREPRKRIQYGQLNRQIWEDCHFAAGQTRIPQLIKSGDHSIPSHLDITKITRYMKISYADALELARVYQILGMNFKSLVTYCTRKKVNMRGVPSNDRTASRVGFSTLIGRFVKRTGKKPWDIPVAIDRSGNKLTLKDLADNLEKLANQDQDAPDWMHYDDGIFQFKMLDDSAAGTSDVLYGSSRAVTDEGFYEYEEDEDQFEVPNPVGHHGGFTYWQDSTIPTPPHLLNSKTNKLFTRIETAILNHRVKLENLPKLNRYIARLTPSQKAKIKQAKAIAFGQAA